MGGFTRTGQSINYRRQRRQRGHSTQSGGTLTAPAMAPRAGMHPMSCAAQWVSLDTVDLALYDHRRCRHPSPPCRHTRLCAHQGSAPAPASCWSVCKAMMSKLICANRSPHQPPHLAPVWLVCSMTPALAPHRIAVQCPVFRAVIHADAAIGYEHISQTEPGTRRGTVIVRESINLWLKDG